MYKKHLLSALVLAAFMMPGTATADGLLDTQPEGCTEPIPEDGWLVLLCYGPCEDDPSRTCASADCQEGPGPYCAHTIYCESYTLLPCYVVKCTILLLSNQDQPCAPIPAGIRIG